MSDELYVTSSPLEMATAEHSFADLLHIAEHTDFSKTLKLPLRAPRLQPPPQRPSTLEARAVGSQSRTTPVPPLASRHRVDSARAPHLRTRRAASGGGQQLGFHGNAPIRSTNAAFVCAAPRISALSALVRTEEVRAKLLWRRATSRITTSTCAMPLLVARTSRNAPIPRPKASTSSSSLSPVRRRSPLPATNCSPTPTRATRTRAPLPNMRASNPSEPNFVRTLVLFNSLCCLFLVSQ